MNSSRIFGALSGGALILMTTVANAVLVEFTETNSQFDPPSFAATYSPTTAMLDLTPGISQVATIGIVTLDTSNSLPSTTANLLSSQFDINGVQYNLGLFNELSSPVTGVNTSSEFSISIGAGNSKVFDLGTLYTALPSTLTITLLPSGEVTGDSSIVPVSNRPPLDISRNAEFLLTTSAVPVPAAIWLFGSGLLGMIGIARRKKAP